MAKKTKKSASKRHLNLLHLFPNLITILGLCVGLSSLRFAMEGRFEMAVAAVVAAAVIDMLDGRLARMLGVTSEFGAQLDSLCDLVNFGIAPMFILYAWKLDSLGTLGWACALFFAICCLIRLARFNTLMEHPENQPSWGERFFVGMPAPAGGLLVLAPLAMLFVAQSDAPQVVGSLDDTVLRPLYLCIWTTIMGVLMVSRLPMLSFKRITVPRQAATLVMAVGGLLMVFAVTKPWVFLLGVGVFYLVSIPIVIGYVIACCKSCEDA